METKTVLSTAVSQQLPGQASFPIVGIGASAGGLEAVNRLLERLPATTGMAYVVVLHLDPTHASILPSLFMHATKMPTCAVEDQMVVKANQLYVIPPNTDMTIAQGVFTLIPRTKTHGQHLSIDTFFRSLAADRKHQAIGVLLSGTGSDGALGLQDIKAEGGTTFAQDESSAAYPEMPHNAIASGSVDAVLLPEEIANTLTKLSFHPYIAHSDSPQSLDLLAADEQAFTKILLLLSGATGVDFLGYKPSSLQRRIFRRMLVMQIEQLADYATYLRDHPAEVKALYQEVLITVTSFFRDPATFDTLKRLIFPEILKNHTAEDPIRIWIPGCSSGEEVYSLAICLRELLEERSLTFPIQLFATDIDATALEKARAGIYSTSALQGISPQRLKRFFLPVATAEETYQVRNSLREWCVFASHNVTKDPPFSRLDMVSCRNLLIYLGSILQKKVLQTFHYALKPHGFLLLGASETTSAFSGFFARIKGTQQLYVTKTSGVKPPFSIPLEERGAKKSADAEPHQMPEHAARERNIKQEADRLLLMNYVPASVVIDANLKVLHTRGHIDPYLNVTADKVRHNLLDMAREGLALNLHAAIDAALKSKSMVSVESLQVTASGITREVRVTVIPMPITKAPSEYRFLILFADAIPSSTRSSDSIALTRQTGRNDKRSAQAGRMAVLEQQAVANQAEMTVILSEREAANKQLQAANEETRSSNEGLQTSNEGLQSLNEALQTSNKGLQTSNEELEISNEELQSLNEALERISGEGLQASKEELQSLNEELETSKEELQSLNEELITSNQELLGRNEQLKAAQEYAEAIVEAVHEPLVVLNKDLQVQRANSSFYQFFHMVPARTEGRFLYTLGKGKWKIPRLQTLLEQAFHTNQPLSDYEVEHSFPIIGRKSLLLKARRILRDRERPGNQLLLLAMEDITERKEVERQKDALLSMTGHELKTPLTTAKLAVQMLQHRSTKAADKRFSTDLAGINSQLNQLTQLVDGLLDATAIETGKVVINAAPFAVDDLVRDTVNELGRTNPTHRLLIEEEAHSEGYGDKKRTSQVLVNLLANAIKYAPQSEPIRVRARTNEDTIILSVQDNGVGIPKSQQKRIFERFTRISDVQQEEIPGLGLGLYIAAEVIKRQGGKIWVESTSGKGATFYFTVPRHKP